jgi:hypothetical protein
MRILLIEPLEPLVLSRTPIVSHEFIASSHSVLSTPPQTTVSGLLGLIHGVDLEAYKNLDHAGLLGKLVEELGNRGCKKPVFKGPLVLFKNFSSEPYVCLGELCAPLNKIRREGGALKAYIDRADCIECVELKVEERIGVKLVRGYEGAVEKVVDMGYMYRYSTVRYERVDGGGSVTPTFVYTLNCDSEIKPDVHRVGGEGRMAKVETIDVEKEPKKLPERAVKALKRLKNPMEVEEGALYLAVTPIPLVPEANTASQPILDLNKPNLLGLEFVEEVIGVIPLKRDAKPKRRVERLSLGYSEVLKARRPQILALPIGTIVKTRKPEKTEEIIETLWSIGLPTLLELYPSSSMKYLQ